MSISAITINTSVPDLKSGSDLSLSIDRSSNFDVLNETDLLEAVVPKLQFCVLVGSVKTLTFKLDTSWMSGNN